MTNTTILIAAFACVASCDKAAPTEPASATVGASRGGFSPVERALLADLPKGNLGLVGGNLLQLQHDLATSPFQKLSAMAGPTIPGEDAWDRCTLSGTPLAMLGAVRGDGSALNVSIVIQGWTVSLIENCAKAAGWPSKLDGDGRFIAIDRPTQHGTVKDGFLVLADGAVLSRQSASLARDTATATTPIDRAALEADVASLASGNATDDTDLVAAMSSIDRSAVWVVGNGAALSPRIGAVRGTFSLAGGIAVDVTAQVTDAKYADGLIAGITNAKTQMGEIGPAIKSAADKLVLEHRGDQVHAALSLSNAELQAMADALAALKQ